MASNTRTLLIVHHSPTDTVRPIARRVIEKCQEAATQAAEALGESAPRIEVVERQALEPDKAELLAADAVIFGTTANFGYISGDRKSVV